MHNISTHKVVLSYLKSINARSISVDEEELNKALKVFSEAIDNVPQKFREDGYNFKEAIENHANQDNLYRYFFNALDEYFYSNPKRDNLKIDLHISYIENMPYLKAEQKYGNTVEIYFGKKFLAQLIAGWFFKNDKNKFLNEIGTLIGHELIHSKQKGLFYSKRKIPSMEKDISEKIEPYKPYLNKLSKNLKKNIEEYINTEGRRKFLNEQQRYYTKLLNNSKIRKGVIPPYLKEINEAIYKALPEELIRPVLKQYAYLIDKKFVSRYKDYTSNKEWYSYISDPREIMAYAYSLVNKAHKKGMSKEELIKAISEPEEYKKELYPLEFYEEFKKFEDDKNMSAQEKRKTWQKFLKHVHGYIGQIYPS